MLGWHCRGRLAGRNGREVVGKYARALTALRRGRYSQRGAPRRTAAFAGTVTMEQWLGRARSGYSRGKSMRQSVQLHTHTRTHTHVLGHCVDSHALRHKLDGGTGVMRERT